MLWPRRSRARAPWHSHSRFHLLLHTHSQSTHAPIRLALALAPSALSRCISSQVEPSGPSDRYNVRFPIQRGSSMRLPKMLLPVFLVLCCVAASAQNPAPSAELPKLDQFDPKLAD